MLGARSIHTFSNDKEEKLYLTPFVSLFRDQALAETRTLSVRGYPGLPDDDYGLLEAYCTDPKCDCRRVMLNVIGRRQGSNFLASISFAFDRDDDMAGPFLDPLNPGASYASVLLLLVEKALADPSYVARLESHYYQVKQAMAEPSHPVHQVLARLEAAESWRASRRNKRKRRRG